MSVDSRFRGNQFFASVANSLKMSTDSRFRGDQLSTWVTDNPETMTRHESCKISYLKKKTIPLPVQLPLNYPVRNIHRLIGSQIGPKR